MYLRKCCWTASPQRSFDPARCRSGKTWKCEPLVVFSLRMPVWVIAQVTNKGIFGENSHQFLLPASNLQRVWTGVKECYGPAFLSLCQCLPASPPCLAVCRNAEKRFQIWKCDADECGKQIRHRQAATASFFSSFLPWFFNEKEHGNRRFCCHDQWRRLDGKTFLCGCWCVCCSPHILHLKPVQLGGLGDASWFKRQH